MRNCGVCPNCSWLAQWNRHYALYLKTNPKDIDWVVDQMIKDAKSLPCQNPKPYETDPYEMQRGKEWALEESI